MSTGRKITIFILLLLTIGLGAVSLYVTYNITQDNAPEDSDASGFGPEATTDLFSVVEKYFREVPCETLMSNYNATTELIDAVNEATEAGTYSFEPANLPQATDIPMQCIFNLGPDHSVVFLAYTYEVESDIDNSAEELYARVKEQYGLNEVVDEGTSDRIKYFFGWDQVTTVAVEKLVCRSVLFESQNDFEYASVVYYGFDDCTDVINLNKILTQAISDRAIQVIDGANLTRIQ